MHDSNHTKAAAAELNVDYKYEVQTIGENGMSEDTEHDYWVLVVVDSFEMLVAGMVEVKERSLKNSGM